MLRIAHSMPCKWEQILPSPFLFFLCFCFACKQTEDKKDYKNKMSEGQLKMLQIIADVRQKINTPDNMFCAEA